MKMLRIPVRVVVLLVVMAAIAMPVSAAASKRPSVMARTASTTVAAKGERVVLKVSVRGAATCTFSSTPAVAGFAGTVACSTGRLTRVAQIRRDSGLARKVTLNVTARSTTRATSRSHVTIEQAGVVAAFLDPTFVQNPDNPLQVTWCASVNDENASSPCQQNNGENTSANIARDPTLAPGVLNFYVGPQGSVLGLVCSTNVGPTVDYADCTNTLTSLGSYTVVTEYSSPSGDKSVTETYDIPAFTTTTTMSESTNAQGQPAISINVVDQNGTSVTGAVGPITLSVSGPPGASVSVFGPPYPTYSSAGCSFSAVNELAGYVYVLSPCSSIAGGATTVANEVASETTSTFAQTNGTLTVTSSFSQLGYVSSSANATFQVSV
jgi:hypothetical protein